MIDRTNPRKGILNYSPAEFSQKKHTSRSIFKSYPQPCSMNKQSIKREETCSDFPNFIDLQNLEESPWISINFSTRNPFHPLYHAKTPCALAWLEVEPNWQCLRRLTESSQSQCFFPKKNQQLKTCSVWILRYYTLKKVTCPLKRGQFPPGKDRTPTTIFSVTSLEESHLELRISIFQVGGRHRKMSSFVLCSSREVDPRWHTRSEASPWGIYSSLVTVFSNT